MNIYLLKNVNRVWTVQDKCADYTPDTTDKKLQINICNCCILHVHASESPTCTFILDRYLFIEQSFTTSTFITHI